MKERVEEKIRDKLIKRLDLIEAGLTLIKDEYHVKNPNGAGGFIDIFAKDSKGNLVIIELKRSNAAAREAITELSKYIALIRRIKNVKNSEVRLIVISTEWNELLVPFSEFYNATTYQLEGYLLKTDNHHEPLTIQRVITLPVIAGRNICRRHFIRYYKNDSDLQNAEKSIVAQAQRIGINDFLIAKFNLNFKDEHYGSTRVLYWAQQLKSREFYLEKITQHLSKEEQEDLFEWISDMDESDSLDELADNLDDQIKVRSEYCEIGHPEKIVQRLMDDLWTLSSIARYGVFKDDDRLTDDLLLQDLKGLTGASFVYYFASSSTDNRSKVEEILKEVETSLFHNDVWRHKIKDIIVYASAKIDCSITIYVFNKDNILETLWLSGADNPFSWTPTFYVVVDPKNDDNAEVFVGNIVWDKKETNLEQAIIDVYGSFKDYLLERHFGSHRVKDSELMKYLGLEYQVDMISITHSGEKSKRNITVRGKSIAEIPTKTFSFVSFLQDRQDIVKRVGEMFDDRHYGSGVFSFGDE